MNLLICYKKCNTCRDVEKMLQSLDIEYEYREIDKDNPTAEEIAKWHKETGLPIKRFFNTSGKIYRENHLKDKLPKMTDEEKYDLLSKDGMLVKRPIFFFEDEIFVGPDVKKKLKSLGAE